MEMILNGLEECTKGNKDLEVHQLDEKEDIDQKGFTELYDLFIFERLILVDKVIVKIEKDDDLITESSLILMNLTKREDESFIN